MSSQAEKVARFRALHRGDRPLLMPNAWDAGSAKLLAAIGFSAIATTSGGFAATLGRQDGSVTRDEVLDHCRALVAATDVPVSADFENGFADAPEGVATAVRLAADTGLAGLSIEDFSGRAADPIYAVELAAARVEAAAEAAHAGDAPLVLTARSENRRHGRMDLADTITRLQRFQAAGADVLFAPGLVKIDDIRHVVDAVDLPVNVLILPGSPPVAELAAVGVARISVGSSLAFSALGAAPTYARDLLERGEITYGESASAGRAIVVDSFTSFARE
jgi:2-methylisocitrate lyase-like PEP mutase family enzyme